MRFKSRLAKIDTNFSKKTQHFFFRKKNNQVKPFGTKLILTKGRSVKQRGVRYDSKKLWNSHLYVIINTIFIRHKEYNLIRYSNGCLSYIPATHGFFLGDYNYSTNLPPYLWYFNKPGLTVILYFLKKFTIFHNLVIKQKSTYAKANGTYCQLLEVMEDLKIAKVKLPSGNSKVVSIYTPVTLGRVANPLLNKTVVGKAGYLKYNGLKPKVRGVAMNPVDHPHGGRTKTNQPEVSPWGWVTKKRK